MQVLRTSRGTASASEEQSNYFSLAYLPRLLPNRWMDVPCFSPLLAQDGRNPPDVYVQGLPEVTDHQPGHNTGGFSTEKWDPSSPAGCIRGPSFNVDIDFLAFRYILLRLYINLQVFQFSLPMPKCSRTPLPLLQTVIN